MPWDLDEWDSHDAILAPDIVQLTEIDLDGGLTSSIMSDDGAYSLALPLLSADSFYMVDADVAALAALSSVQQFLAKHPADAALRIIVVEEAGSAGARALRDHNTVTDPRLVLLTSKNPKAIAQMGEKGVPCAYVAVEADREYYKGKRPSRSRSQHVYDKSGKEGSPGATVLGTATSARYTQDGKLGESYEVTLVPLKSSSPLLTAAKCHTVIYVMVPSRNANHKLEVCYVKDDVQCSSILEKCYTSLLDKFFNLSRIKTANNETLRPHGKSQGSETQPSETRRRYAADALTVGEPHAIIDNHGRDREHVGESVESFIANQPYRRFEAKAAATREAHRSEATQKANEARRRRSEESQYSTPPCSRNNSTASRAAAEQQEEESVSEDARDSTLPPLSPAPKTPVFLKSPETLRHFRTEVDSRALPPEVLPGRVDVCSLRDGAEVGADATGKDSERVEGPAQKKRKRVPKDDEDAEVDDNDDEWEVGGGEVGAGGAGGGQRLLEEFVAAAASPGVSPAGGPAGSRADSAVGAAERKRADAGDDAGRAHLTAVDNDSDPEDPCQKFLRVLDQHSKKRLDSDDSPQKLASPQSPSPSRVASRVAPASSGRSDNSRRNTESTPKESESESLTESRAERWAQDQTTPVKTSIAQRKHDKRLCICRPGTLCDWAKIALNNSTD
jgi:hypothetical protein